MCKTKVPLPVLGAEPKKLQMRDKKRRKKLFKFPFHREKEIIFYQHTEINILSTLLWFIPIFSCFKLWLHLVSDMTTYRLFRTSVMQAGTRMERNTSRQRIRGKYGQVIKICLLFQILTLLLINNFSLTKIASYSSVSTDTFAAAKMLLLSLILASVCFC